MSIIVLGFTPRRSTARSLLIAPLSLCSSLIISGCARYIHRDSWAALVGGYSTTFLLQYISIVISDRCNLSLKPVRKGSRAQGPEVDPWKTEARSRFWDHLASGINACFSFRWSGTPLEVKNVPLFSTQDRNFVPSRGECLRHHASLLVFCYLTLDCLGLAADAEKNAFFFAPDKIPFFARLGQVSSAEFAMRLFGSLGSGVGILCAQQGVYSIIVLFFVGSGLSEPREWRPLFGSFSEAYSLRKFWGHVWHQNNRAKTSHPAQFIVQEMLRLPLDSFLGRQTCFFMIFLISGLLHATIDLSAGIPWQASGAVRFFCTQAIGIWVEEASKAVYRYFIGTGQRAELRRRWSTSLGYAWVVLFLAWSWPSYMYPMLYKTKGGSEDSLLPFSILRHVL